MNTTEIVHKIQKRFSDKILDLHQHNKKRVYISIDKKDLLELARYLFEDLGARFSTASAMDTPPGIEFLYHFSYDKLGMVISVKTLSSRDNPEIESISSIVTAAQWIEREIHDFLGVEFLNHPDPRRLLLADDWPEGVHPYRKEFKGND